MGPTQLELQNLSLRLCVSVETKHYNVEYFFFAEGKERRKKERLWLSLSLSNDPFSSLFLSLSSLLNFSLFYHDLLLLLLLLLLLHSLIVSSSLL